MDSVAFDISCTTSLKSIVAEFKMVNDIKGLSLVPQSWRTITLAQHGASRALTNACMRETGHCSLAVHRP